MLSLLVAKQAWKDDFFIRGDTPISSRMFLFKGVCRSLHFCFKVNQSIYFYFTLFIFLVFKLRVKRILVHFYFQLFRLYICTVNVTPAYVGRNPEIFHNTL